MVNAMRGLLAEYGIVWPTGINALRNALAAKLEGEQAKLTPLSQELFGKLCAECKKVEAEVAYDDEKLQALATMHPESQRLLTIPGIGPSTATALLAAVGDGGLYQWPAVCCVVRVSPQTTFDRRADALIGHQ